VLVARAQRGSVALGEPRSEASARRREPRGELRVERGDLLAKLEEAEVEQVLGIALVEVDLDALYGHPALGARHEAGLWERAEHGNR
jgi:hypothetical protein